MTASEMLERYEGVAKNAVRGMYVHGHDRDDLLQEARMGMLEAFAVWDRSRPFAPIAHVAARRQVFDLLIRSRRVKRGAGEAATSLSAPVFGFDDLPVEGTVAAPATGVADAAAARVRLRAVLAALPSLTELERRAVVGLAAGYTYTEIGGTFKQVDNAVQRGRRKLREAA